MEPHRELRPYVGAPTDAEEIVPGFYSIEKEKWIVKPLYWRILCKTGNSVLIFAIIREWQYIGGYYDYPKITFSTYSRRRGGDYYKRKSYICFSLRTAQRTFPSLGELVNSDEVSQMLAEGKAEASAHRRKYYERRKAAQVAEKAEKNAEKSEA